MWTGNYRQAIRYAERLKQLDSESYNFRLHARNYIYLGETDTAASIILDGINRLEERGMDVGDSWMVAYAYQLMGKKEMADSLLISGNERNLEQLRFPVLRTQLGNTHFAIARRYSMLGNREKTLEYLQYLINVPGVNYCFIHELENWPSFDLVRDTPEFREIMKHLKSRFRSLATQAFGPATPFAGPLYYKTIKNKYHEKSVNDYRNNHFGYTHIM
jgi:tetratricopeptide (TPR) repeat protein